MVLCILGVMARKLRCEHCQRKWLASFPEQFAAHVAQCLNEKRQKERAAEQAKTQKKKRVQAQRKEESKKRKFDTDLVNSGAVYGYPPGYWNRDKNDLVSVGEWTPRQKGKKKRKGIQEKRKKSK